MADIVYRLRAFQRGDWTSDTVNEICGEAASEIERLRANQQYTCEEHAGEVRKGGRCVWCELRDVRASLSRAEEALKPFALAEVVMSSANYRGADRATDWTVTTKEQLGLGVFRQAAEAHADLVAHRTGIAGDGSLETTP